MVSESLQDTLCHMLSGFGYRATQHLCPRTKPNSGGREGELDPNFNISEPLQDSLDHLLSDFRYRVTHHLFSRTKPNSVGCECVC